MKITNRQINNSVNTYQLYQAKLRKDTDDLKRELFYNGNTENKKTEQLRRQIKEDSESLSKFLDEVV